jgi:hypothetical protein
VPARSVRCWSIFFVKPCPAWSRVATSDIADAVAQRAADKRRRVSASLKGFIGANATKRYGTVMTFDAALENARKLLIRWKADVADVGLGTRVHALNWMPVHTYDRRQSPVGHRY